MFAPKSTSLQCFQESSHYSTTTNPSIKLMQAVDNLLNDVASLHSLDS